MDNNELETNLEENSPFVKCGKCGSTYPSSIMRFCPNPLKNRDGKAHICWYCCNECSWAVMVAETGGLTCGMLNCFKGVFWLVKNKLVCYKTSLNKDDSGFEEAWFELFGKTEKGNKFNDYPHGRVIIDNNKPVIILYNELFSESEIKQIAKEYWLDTTVYEIIKEYKD